LSHDRTPPSWFARAWIVASGLGLGISGAAAGALAPNGGEFGMAAAPSVTAGIRHYGPPALLAFAVWGVGLGVAQWVVVRRRIPGSGWWAPVTAAGWALTGATIGVVIGGIGGGPAAFDAGDLAVAFAVSFSVLAIGVFPATAQWLILRRGRQPWPAYMVRFVLGLAVGGVAGWVVGTVAGLTFPSGPAWVVVGSTMGAAIGAVTASPIARCIASPDLTSTST
jgi:hypothetical protein